MLIVTGVFEIDPAHSERLRKAAIVMAEATRTETGCQTYAFWQDLDSATRIRVYEEWDDRAALEAHFEAPHMQVWRAELAKGGLLSRNVVTVANGDVQPL